MDALITNGAIAADGGSISLWGVDAQGGPLRLFLDNSIRSHREGTRSLKINEQVIPIGSSEEVHWLTVLATARVEYRLLAGEVNVRFSQHELNESLADLVRSLMHQVTSDAYQNQKPPPPPPPPLEDRLLELLLDGKDLDALKLYRKSNPDVSLADAKAAIEKLKNQ